MDVFAVEAFAASWIEIPNYEHVLRGHMVEAFAASWIEIGAIGPQGPKGDTVEANAASWIELALYP